MSANFAFPHSFDPRSLATASPATAAPATARPRRQHPEAIGRGASGPEPRFAEQFHSFVDSNAQLARRAAKETGDHPRTRPEARTKDDAAANDEENKTSKRSNSVRPHPFWNPMWHAIPVARKALPANISSAGPARTGFEILQAEGGAAQGDTFSANANFLTAPIPFSDAAAETTEELSTGRSGWSGRGAENLPLGASYLRVVMAASLTAAPNLSSVGSQSVTGVRQGGEKMLNTTVTLGSRQVTQGGGWGGGTNGAGEGVPTSALVPRLLLAESSPVPLSIDGQSVTAEIPTYLAAAGAGSPLDPDTAELEPVELRLLDGSGSGSENTVSEGFTLDSREWLRVEQRPPFMETPTAPSAMDGVCVLSPDAHSTVAQPVAQPMPPQLVSAPAPTFAGRMLLKDGQGLSLAVGHLERELPGKGVMQDPISFVVRVAGEASQVAGGPLEPAKLGEPEPVVAPATLLPAPDDGLPIQSARKTAFDQAGKKPGPNELRTGMSESAESAESGPGDAQVIAAYESSPGGQRDDGERRQDPALGSQGPHSIGERDFSSWVPGFGAEVAGRPSPHPDGSGPGAKTGKQVEAAIEPELAPERLSAAPRQLVLTIPSGSDGEGVLASVHVRNHNGGVEIAVRTPDAQLSSSLQESLPELVARLETQGTGANVARGDQLSNGGPADGSGRRDGQSQDWQPQDGQPGEEPRGGGREERQQHPEDRGQPRGQPGTQIRELRQQRQARWQASLGLAPR